jgi:WD40 repeat protein
MARVSCLHPPITLFDCGTQSVVHISTPSWGILPWISSAAFSPDGTRVVSGSEDKNLRLWDAVSGACLNTLTGHSQPVWSVAFSPDGTRVVSGSQDNSLRLWDAVSGTCLNTINGHSGTIYSAVFSPDGMRIVSGSADKVFDCGM